MFKDKTLLITGGTGSFGNEVLRYFLKNTNIKEIRIFSRDEEKQDCMRHELLDERIRYYIGDVRNFDSLNDALKNVDFIFHAAALKQVPSCEFYPMEAVRTNILGANNLLEAAVVNKVKRTIVLSTDKAVYPINAMGMTKALMEKLMIAKSRIIDSEVSTFCATRYGNVMASRGSVIPLFVKQCKENKPITITDPSMTRFLMSLEESVQLVLYTYENANSGDIFVQKASASTIIDLAEAIKKIFNSNSPINIIGTRHGEKKHETLVNREEMAKAVDLGKFYRIPCDERNLNYDKYFNTGDLTIVEKEDYNSGNTEQLSIDKIVEKLMDLKYIQNELAEVRVKK